MSNYLESGDYEEQKEKKIKETDFEQHFVMDKNYVLPEKDKFKIKDINIIPLIPLNIIIHELSLLSLSNIFLKLFL